MQFPGIVIVSYAWGARDHPDPSGRLLREVLAPAIEWYMSERTGGYSKRGKRSGALDFGMFLDFTSMFQKPRAQEEDAAFRRALSCMDVLYAHQRTVKWRLTRQPPGVEGLPYSARGWPFFETIVSGLASFGTHVLDLGLVDFTLPLRVNVGGEGQAVSRELHFQGASTAF